MNGKPTAALCHGTALLLDLKDKKGRSFIKGRKMTGFANSEEDFAVQDRNLITGQQQNSGKAVAQLILKALNK